MSLSIRAYGRHRGVSDTAVHKALRAGRIQLEPDGTIDPAKADEAWARNGGVKSKPPRTAPRRSEKPQAEIETRGGTFADAQRANEILKAQLNAVKLAKAKGEVVSVEEMRTVSSRRYTAVRDNLLNVADRLANVLAHESDPGRIHAAITSEIRRVLNELADNAEREANLGVAA